MMGQIEVPAKLLEFGTGGPGFALVDVEDLIGQHHRGRFVDRKLVNGQLHLRLGFPDGSDRWIECDPDRTVTILDDSPA